ncbi:MAG: hypothetical protein GF364_11550, partial [Candidatus Lokiarchaeota archaeon]|nr:hypothetical protein [Candidatus Lokiarchaeota archaeon]
MSQASPIGSVEFIIKFDSMQDSFAKVLRDALKETGRGRGAGEGGSGGSRLESKVDELVFNVRSRLRQPFSGEWSNFLLNAEPHQRWAQKKETRKKLREWFLSEDVGKNMLSRGKDESTEKYKKRLNETVDSILDGYISELQKGKN